MVQRHSTQGWPENGYITGSSQTARPATSHRVPIVVAATLTVGAARTRRQRLKWIDATQPMRAASRNTTRAINPRAVEGGMRALYF